MGILNKSSKLILIILTTPLMAAPITKERFTPLYTLQDDRAALTINDNFRRATNIVVEDRGSGLKALSAFQQVTYNYAQPDTDYSIFVTVGWNPNFMWVLQKTTTGFVLATGAGPTDPKAGFDWILVR